MEINPELITLMVIVFAVLKGGVFAINKLISMVAKEKTQKTTEKREERIAAMEEKINKIEHTTKQEQTRIDNLEQKVVELHDCIDRLDEKNEMAHEATAMRLDDIHGSVAKLDGKIDIIQVLIQKFINGGRK